MSIRKIARIIARVIGRLCLLAIIFACAVFVAGYVLLQLLHGNKSFTDDDDINMRIEEAFAAQTRVPMADITPVGTARVCLANAAYEYVSPEAKEQLVEFLNVKRPIEFPPGLSDGEGGGKYFFFIDGEGHAKTVTPWQGWYFTYNDYGEAWCADVSDIALTMSDRELTYKHKEKQIEFHIEDIAVFKVGLE